MALFKPKYVECAECGHLIARENAQEIPVYTKWTVERIGSFFYCDAHKKDCKKILRGWITGDSYIKEFQVDEHGTPIGFEPKRYEGEPIVTKIQTEKKEKKVGRPSNEEIARRKRQAKYQHDYYVRKKARKAALGLAK